VEGAAGAGRRSRSGTSSFKKGVGIPLSETSLRISFVVQHKACGVIRNIPPPPRPAKVLEMVLPLWTAEKGAKDTVEGARMWQDILAAKLEVGEELEVLQGPSWNRDGRRSSRATRQSATVFTANQSIKLVAVIATLCSKKPNSAY